MSTTVTEQDWGPLDAHAPAFGLLNARKIGPDSSVLLGVDHDGLRHLLIALASKGSGFRDVASRGLAVRERALEVDGLSERPFLDLSCVDPTGGRLFNLVASEVINEVQGGGEPAAAVRSTVARWRRFWGAARTDGLTPEQLRGLFGELWFLARWALPHGLATVARWNGPTGSRHDFEWPAFSVETKTTTSIRGHVHRVSGLDQLDPPDNGQLYLFSLRVREEPGAAQSLTTLIDHVSVTLANAANLLTLFETRLGQAGYSPADAARYEDVRFHVADQRLYKVADRFPRLTSASFASGLPLGVERVEYEINLETCVDLCVATDPSDPKISLGW